MDNNDLGVKRGEVVEKFINIETLLSCIISQHYLGRADYHFMYEVIHDEHFSFALKRRVFEKILKKTENQNKELIEKLHKVNKIRNYFAHFGKEFIDFQKGTTYYINPNDPDKQIDFNECFEDFMEIEPEITRELGRLNKKLGGEIS